MRFGNVIQGEQAEAAGQAVMLGTDGRIPAEMLPETSGGGTGGTVISTTAASDSWLTDNVQAGDLVYLDGGVSTAGGYWTTFFGTCSAKDSESLTLDGSGWVQHMGMRSTNTFRQIVRIEIDLSAKTTLNNTYISGTELHTDDVTYFGGGNGKARIWRMPPGGGEPRADTSTVRIPEAPSSFLSSDLLAGVVA